MHGLAIFKPNPSNKGVRLLDSHCVVPDRGYGSKKKKKAKKKKSFPPQIGVGFGCVWVVFARALSRWGPSAYGQVGEWGLGGAGQSVREWGGLGGVVGGGGAGGGEGGCGGPVPASLWDHNLCLSGDCQWKPGAHVKPIGRLTWRYGAKGFENIDGLTFTQVLYNRCLYCRPWNVSLMIMLRQPDNSPDWHTLKDRWIYTSGEFMQQGFGVKCS